ncbi:type VI secretion system secreted protein VgrG [Pseudoduganella lurida]|uniref:Type VI secretion system secreted protein VgrG n=1 Tax=Pseudoduganella lurida TaxID=1036180 RepID=A0A562RAS0_9BURK|nr:type VI secretion system Vgr family protein [Pseudoduganella lurida]TWI65476.1 type VI secretion system secreted protein VgrG [Pseudoduganella lurida]
MDYDEPGDTDLIAQLLTARHRPIRLVLALADGPSDDILLPQRVSGTEAICDGIELRVYCLSLDAGLPLKELIGVAAQVQLVTDAGDLRSLCGIVTEASQGESDGGLATYQLVLRDALAVLDLAVNTRVFLGKTELEIVQLLLAEARRHNPALAASFEFEVNTALGMRRDPTRSQIIQYNERTGAFIRRLLRRRGIGWFFRPGRASAAETDSEAPCPPVHTMVLFDDARRLKQSPAGVVRFHRNAATEERDTITAWCGVRTLQPGRFSYFSWDHANPRGTGFMTASAASEADQGTRGTRLAAELERYLIEAPHVRDDHEDLTVLARQAMARSDFEAKCYVAEGGVRSCAAGEYFTLDGHPDMDQHGDGERDFVIVSQHIVAQNNLPKAYDARVERLFARNRWETDPALPVAARNWFDAGEMRFFLRMTCVRRDTRFVPAPDLQNDRPHAAMQSAIVVGPTGETVHCDELGRIKVRFSGMREKDHAHAEGAGASGADADSAWVRVATNWAGPISGSGSHFGALTLPRAGTEVLIAFLGGDPDKPVVIGQLYNTSGRPPHFGTDGLPGNRYLSGMQSREVKGTRVNQLRLDDTPGQINAQLSSDHGRSELNLGWLTQPRTKGTGTARGEGAELTTDQQLALRAGKGMLLSAWQRLGSGGRQLDRSDYLALMEECVELFRSLGEYAASHEGLAVDAAAQDGLKSGIKNWDKSGAAAIGVTAPDGISFATSKAVVTYAATNIDTVAQQHLQLTAGQRMNVNAGKGISLFSHANGLRAIAHHGPLLMQSQFDTTQIDSGKDVKISAKGRVIIQAEELVFVNTGGAYIALKGGAPEIGGPGALTVKTDGHNWNGAASKSADLPKFTDGEFVRTPRVLRGSDGEPVEGVKINVEVDGQRRTVTTNSAGEGEKITSDTVQQLRAFFDPKDI